MGSISTVVLMFNNADLILLGLHPDPSIISIVVLQVVLVVLVVIIVIIISKHPSQHRGHLSPARSERPEHLYLRITVDGVANPNDLQLIDMRGEVACVFYVRRCRLEHKQ